MLAPVISKHTSPWYPLGVPYGKAGLTSTAFLGDRGLRGSLYFHRGIY